MAGNTISSTFVLSSVLGAGWLSNMGKAKKDLNVLGGLIGAINREQKALKKSGADPDRLEFLKKLNGYLGPVNNGINGVVKSTGALLGFFARGAGVAATFGGALFGMAKTTADYAAEVGHTANALGIGMDALQEFRYSASLANVEASAFDDAVKKLNVNLGKSLAESGGEAAKAFASLGLGLDALESMPADERLLQIGDALKKVTSEAERARLSSMIFGAGKSAQVGAWLAQGSGAISADRAESRKNGGNATMADFAAAQNFGKALADLKATAAGLWRSLGLQVLQPVADILRDITGFIKDNKAAFASGFSALVTAAKSVMTPLKGVMGVLLNVGAWLAGSPALINASVYALGALGLVIGALKFGAFISSIGAAFTAFSAMSKGVGLAKVAMVGFNIVTSANPIGLVVTGIGLLIAGIIALWKNWDTVNKWMDEHPFLAALATAVTGPVGIIIQSIRLLKNNWDSVVFGLGVAWEAIKLVFSWSPFGIVLKTWGKMFDWLEGKFGVMSKIGGMIKGVGRALGFGKGDDSAAPAAPVGPDLASGRDPAAADSSSAPSPVQRLRSIENDNLKIQAAEAARVNNSRASVTNNTPITINAAPGQSPEEIARAVADEMESRNQSSADSLMTDFAHA